MGRFTRSQRGLLFSCKRRRGALLTQAEPQRALYHRCYLVSQVLRLCCSNAAGAKNLNLFKPVCRSIGLSLLWIVFKLLCLSLICILWAEDAVSAYGCSKTKYRHVRACSNAVWWSGVSSYCGCKRSLLSPRGGRIEGTESSPVFLSFLFFTLIGTHHFLLPLMSDSASPV